MTNFGDNNPLPSAITCIHNIENPDLWGRECDKCYNPRHQTREKTPIMKYVIRALVQAFIAGLFIYGCLWLIGVIGEELVTLLP